MIRFFVYRCRMDDSLFYYADRELPSFAEWMWMLYPKPIYAVTCREKAVGHRDQEDS